jgi:hypothetical protein
VADLSYNLVSVLIVDLHGVCMVCVAVISRPALSVHIAVNRRPVEWCV